MEIRRWRRVQLEMKDGPRLSVKDLRPPIR
jgi:hypothetical protein